MLTLFTAPKAFRGHIGVIQRNAIRSWTLLGEGCRVIVFGDEEGTAEAAQDLGVEHVPEVERNEYGTPLVSDLFRQAWLRSRYEVMCYVNADIVFLSDLRKAVARVAGLGRRFLLAGRRWNVDWTEPLEFDPGWEERLRSHVRERGSLYKPSGIDYFVHPRGLWPQIPPFAVGRAGWDNWMVYGARRVGARVIDATPVVLCIHQNHDYAHQPEGRLGTFRGPEARRNLELGGGKPYMFHMEDATHILTAEGLRRARWRGRVGRRLETLAMLRPWLRFPLRAARRAWRGW